MIWTKHKAHVHKHDHTYQFKPFELTAIIKLNDISVEAQKNICWAKHRM